MWLNILQFPPPNFSTIKRYLPTYFVSDIVLSTGNQNLKLSLGPQEAWNLGFFFSPPKNSSLMYSLFNSDLQESLYADKALESLEKNKLHLSINFDVCLVL